MLTQVWEALHDPTKVVIAQIAPAVRVAIGEGFGMSAGETSMGQVVSALRKLGFDQVYDTSFAADLTVIEEANEFMRSLTRGKNSNTSGMRSCVVFMPNVMPPSSKFS